MDVKKFSGVYPAVITPFTPEGEVDVEKLTNYINYLSDRVDGLFVGGSYGSGPIMSVEQRKTLAEVTIKTAAGRVPVIMHIGTTNLNDTLSWPVTPSLSVPTPSPPSLLTTIVTPPTSSRPITRKSLTP